MNTRNIITSDSTSYNDAVFNDYYMVIAIQMCKC